MVDILEGAPPAILHADPKLVPPQVRAEVGHDVGMPAILHHEDLLLNDAKVVPLLQLDHFDGGEVPGRQTLRLKWVQDKGMKNL